MGFQMQVLPQAECRDCKPLRADLNAANRENHQLRNEIQILTRERDNLLVLVGRGGVDTGKLNQE